MSRQVIFSFLVWIFQNIPKHSLKDFFLYTGFHRSFSLTWSSAMQMSWNKTKCLHEKGVEIPQKFLGTPNMFRRSNTSMWLPKLDCWKRSITKKKTSRNSAQYFSFLFLSFMLVDILFKGHLHTEYVLYSLGKNHL